MSGQYEERTPFVPSVVREKHGVVYTKAWVVDLLLDLVGYTPEKRLGEMTLVESGGREGPRDFDAGDGGFGGAGECGDFAGGAGSAVFARGGAGGDFGEYGVRDDVLDGGDGPGAAGVCDAEFAGERAVGDAGLFAFD